MTEKQPTETVTWKGKKWPILTAEEMASLCGFTADYLRKIERAGGFKKSGRDRYSPPAVFRGVLAFVRDEERGSSKSAESRRLLDARARQLELRIARESGELIEMVTVEDSVADILGRFRSELSGVPAASTRDMTIRAAIEEHLENAIGRAHDAFEKKANELEASSRKASRR